MKKLLLIICICITFNVSFAQTKSINLVLVKNERQKTDGKERRSPIKFSTPLLIANDNIYTLSNLVENASVIFEVWNEDEFFYSIQLTSTGREAIIQIPPMTNPEELHFYITINNRTYTNFIN